MLDAEIDGEEPAGSRLASSWPAFVAPEIAVRSDRSERHDRIADLVARQIIPRLVIEHELDRPEVQPRCLEKDVCGLVKLVLGADIDAAAEQLEALKVRGVTTDTLFLDLLEPAARYLGEMWERDECDFIDVTLGVGRLQNLLSIFGETRRAPASNEQRSIFLSVTPGDQHSFGASMVERFLRGGGWTVHVEDEPTTESIAIGVSERWFAVAGLSLGSEVRIDALADAIAAIRHSSCNRSIKVMVGGPTFSNNAALAFQLGADATAVNGPTAVVAAQKLFDTGARAGWA